MDDGTKGYFEQIGPKPTDIYIYVVGPNESWKIYGHIFVRHWITIYRIRQASEV